MLKKIDRLLAEIAEHPYWGIGKPEPLRGDLKGKWARRITEEHRIVYYVAGDTVVIESMYGHYE